MNGLIRRMVPSWAKRLVKGVIARIQLTDVGRIRVGGDLDSHWRRRIDDVVSCPDNAWIPRVVSAGSVAGYHVTMHNGVKVCANGYYGRGMLNMLVQNRGVHEPQEERSFQTIISLLPEKCVMLELGAYWGFYSLSLLQVRPKATCFLVEPNAGHLASGKINFKLNGRRGRFVCAFVGDQPRRDPRTISVDSLCERKSIERLHVLHSDTDGGEMAVLKGAKAMLSSHRVDYVFISTHSNDLHAACSAKLMENRYVVLASANLDQTYSYDGLVVAKRDSLPEPRILEISLKRGLSVSQSCRSGKCGVKE